MLLTAPRPSALKVRSNCCVSTFQSRTSPTQLAVGPAVLGARCVIPWARYLLSGLNATLLTLQESLWKTPTSVCVARFQSFDSLDPCPVNEPGTNFPTLQANSLPSGLNAILRS